MCKDHILQIRIAENMPEVAAGARQGVEIHPWQMIQ